MYFVSEKFFFNGISGKQMNVELVTFDDSLFQQRGLVYSEKSELIESYSPVPFYSNSKNEDTEDIKLNIILVSENGQQAVWDDMKLREVIDWLITDDFEPFISEDDLNSVYYLKATKITKMFTTDNTGYLEVTFKPYSNYVYHLLRETGSDESKIKINNVSNVDSNYKPVIEAECTGSKITIQNEDLPDLPPLEISGYKGKIFIDNLFRTVQAEDGTNLLPKCNRQWIELKKGSNTINIVGGTATVICEFPIIK